MATSDRERQSQRLFWAMIVLLILGYGVIKARHIVLAMQVYHAQVLQDETPGAAK